MNLQKLISQRNAQKSVIEHYLTKIAAVKENFSLIEYNTILESLETKKKQLETLNEKITGQTEVDEIHEEILQTEMYMLDLDIKVRHLIEFRDKANAGTQLNVNANPFDNQNVSSVHSNSSQFHRLPKLSLPTFNGDILKWQSFWDSFESTIHLNINLTDVQKFTYLQSQLEGAAARTIDGFALTNANYLRAINLLKERFGQEHKIMHATMQALIQLPAPSDTLSSLRNFHDRMETYIRGLESMGQSQESYGSLLVPIILDKMPSDIRKNLAREHGDNNWQLQDLSNTLCKEITIMEAGSQSILPEVNEFISTASFYSGVIPKQRGQHNRDRTTSAFTDRRRYPFTCAFCEESHKSNDCVKFPDLQSRLQKVKDKKLCFNCLRQHLVSKCSSHKRCQICKKKHHTSICSTSNTEQRGDRHTSELPTPRPDAIVLHASTRQTCQGVLLKTATSTVSSGQIQTDASILFDEGSQKSFITEALAQELQLPTTGTEPVHLATFGNQTEKLQHLDTATLYLVLDRKEKLPIRVLIVPTIATPMNASLHHTASQLPYLRGLNLAHPVTGAQTFTISMLIGADHYWDIIEDHVIRGNGPTAVKSKIGYLLSGPVNTYYSTKSTNHIFNVITSHARDDAAIERFWSLESMGITPNTEQQQKTDYLVKYQQTSIELADDKYTAALPWKIDHEPLPSNYDITKRRTESTIRRLSREPEMLQKYGEIIAEQEQRGFIEKIYNSAPVSETLHYIPHHPVRKDSSTTPIRIVYDCSCRQSSDQPSLNDCLESTAPILNELTSILTRFRLKKYAVATDIEKAFLHIGLHRKDRDVTRFLWLSDPSDPESPLCTYRFKAVLFSATSSPFILNATILRHLELHKSNTAAEILERDLYVDNVLSSFQQQSDLLTYFRNARDLMMRASMNLRSWTSNSPALRDIAAQEGVLDRDEVTKVLGMRWNPKVDTMTFTHREIPTLDTVTKRDILKYSSRIYDPLGLLSPVTVRAKLLLQQLWKDKCEWDVPLADDVRDTWYQLATDLNSVTNIEFSRQYFSKPDDNQTEMTDTCLHVFVDASIKSYGATAYITNGKESRLVMAKNRVAPLKSMTLPQLELMAAVVGARLVTHVQQSLGISNITCWSDSQIILHWLSSSKPLKRFVRNRVQEIQTLTGNHLWNYCPTSDNPADLLTRGIPADQLINNRLWNAGPLWIGNRSEWPVWKRNDTMMQTTANQKTTDDGWVSNNVDHQQTRVVTSLQCTLNEGVHHVINVEKYSKYSKLLRVTAYVLRFITNCKNPLTRYFDVLTATELENAERKWLKSCQEMIYPDEMTSLRTKAATRLPLIKQLRLFVDSYGIIHCGGRIHNAPLPDVARFPYLLPKKHPITRLIVFDTHENQLHAGTNATATQIRQKYWIPAIRQCIKSVLRICVSCSRVQGKPYRAPDPPPLPKLRVEESPPFSVTGVDYTGALYVRDRTGSQRKVYICLFTCASTRALHLELVSDLSQESFLQAFRRFSSRRSLPKIIMSDNATTFIGASQHLKHLFESASIKAALSRKGTEWHFIPKRAPWYGGWWERLIGLTKTTLKKILGRSLVTMETLQTVVIEIEAMLNDRPLTSVPSSYDDLDPLTPSHLLYGRRLTSLPYNNIAIDFGQLSKQAEYPAMTKRAKLQSTILNQFWKRWRMEYLTALRESHRKSGTNTQTIAVGDVVQIHDECPRTRWKLGVVVELITGRDDLTRAAKVRTTNGVTTRPIVKLYPLEVFCDSDT